MSVYIIRHGESLANLHSDLPLREGWGNVEDATVPLSQWGFRQAVEAGAALRGELDAAAEQGRKVKILHSPYLRTEQTTQGVIQGLGRGELPREAHAGMREQNFGLFDCITDRRLIARLWPKEHREFVEARKQDKHHARAPDGESRADVVERVRGFLADHAADFADPDTDVVVIGHGLVNRALEMCLRGEDTEWLRKEPNPGNCAIRKLEGNAERGYTAQYIHHGKERPQHLPKDYQALPYGQKALEMAR